MKDKKNQWRNRNELPTNEANKMFILGLCLGMSVGISLGIILS